MHERPSPHSNLKLTVMIVTSVTSSRPGKPDETLKKSDEDIRRADDFRALHGSHLNDEFLQSTDNEFERRPLCGIVRPAGRHEVPNALWRAFWNRRPIAIEHLEEHLQEQHTI